MDALTRWLNSLGLAKYAAILREQEIDLDVLGELTEDDLTALSIPLGPRRKILRALRRRGESAPSSDTAEDGSASARLATERKQVTVLFADLVGSTALIDGLDPEDAHERMRPALDAMMDAVHRYEGTVNRVQGDGIMALFGAPIAHEDHAARASRAALRMQRDLRLTASDGLRIRVGLHSGEVLVHALDNDLTVDYEAEGPSVHLAARLESLAEPGQVLVSAQTCSLAGAAVEARSLGCSPVKGLLEPVELFQLLDAPEDLSRWDITTAAGLTRLSGRESELEIFMTAAQRASAGSGQALLLVGDAGVGKSRLLHEAATRLDSEGWQVVECAASAYERHSTYHVAGRLVAAALELDPRAAVAERSAALAAAVRAIDPELGDCVPALRHLMGLPVDDSRWFRFDPPQQHRLAIEGLRRLLAGMSAASSLAVLVEDLHWLDPGSQAVLDALVEGLGNERALLMMSARPEFKHSWTSRTWFTQMPVAALDPANASAMIDSLLAVGPAQSSLAELIIAHAGGTPLYIEECVRSLRETGALVGERGAYRVSGPVDAVDIPPTVQAVIAARIDRLPFAARALLQAAAVLGSHLPVAVLEQVVIDDGLDPVAALVALEVAELLVEVRISPRELTFRHALVRDVAYQTLARERRRELHARAGEALESYAAKDLDDHVEVAAEHYRLGECWERAAPLALRAARRAKERFAYERAKSLAGLVQDCAANLADGTGYQIDAHRLLGDLHSLTGDREAANASYARAMALCDDAQLEAEIRNRYHFEHVATRNGAQLAYYLHGAARETIVFVIPVAYDLAMFQSTIEELCNEFRLVTIDPRGNGRSDAIPAGFTFTDSVEDLRSVIDDLGKDPVHLVAQSRGAQTAIRFAERYPQLASSLVLIGLKADRGSYSRWIDEFADRIRAGDVEELARILIAQVFSEPETADVAEQQIRALTALPAETLLTFFKVLPDFDARKLAPHIATRTLIVHGTDDRNTPFEDAQLMARLLPNAQLRPFPNRGHLPNFSARSEFCEALAAFVRNEPVPGVV